MVYVPGVVPESTVHISGGFVPSSVQLMAPAVGVGVTVQVELVVTSTSTPFAVAIALNCAWPPDVETEAEVGSTLRLLMLARKTVAVAVPWSACALVVITDVPGPTPVSMPVFVSIVATVGVALDHDTPRFTCFREPSS